MEDFDEDFYDQPEAPCEICGLSFPIQLLLEHELFVHNDEQYSVPSSDPLEVLATIAKDQQQYHVQTEDPFERLVTTAVEGLQTSNLIDLQPINQNKKGRDVSEEKAVIKENVMLSSKKEEVTEIPKAKPVTIGPFFEEPELNYEESLPEESGTKIMTYGTSMKKNERVEVEKPTYRVPTLLHMSNVDRKEREVPVFVSDDDDEDSETLEDFWKRAEIRLSQQLKKTIQL